MSKQSRTPSHALPRFRPSAGAAAAVDVASFMQGQAGIVRHVIQRILQRSPIKWARGDTSQGRTFFPRYIFTLTPTPRRGPLLDGRAVGGGRGAECSAVDASISSLWRVGVPCGGSG
jgi:hypothetical protein